MPHLTGGTRRAAEDRPIDDHSGADAVHCQHIDQVARAGNRTGVKLGQRAQVRFVVHAEDEVATDQVAQPLAHWHVPPPEVRRAHHHSAIDINDAGNRNGDASHAAPAGLHMLDCPTQLLRQDGQQVVERRRRAAERPPSGVDGVAGQVVGEHRGEADIEFESEGDHTGAIELEQRGRAADALVRLRADLFHQTTIDEVGDQAGHGGASQAGHCGNACPAAWALRGQQSQDQREVVAPHMQVLDRGVNVAHAADCIEGGGRFVTTVSRR